MNQFGLIIQETTAGSGEQFVSPHLDVNNPEIKETITDERFIATQLANLTDVYSVQITKNYKVYSLIVTDLADFLGRSGYYAIRLYGPKGVNLTNFESILASIKERYNSYTSLNNTDNQNYDAILSSILIIENQNKNYFSLKSNVNCFYYFEETNTALSTVFNTQGINLVHKVYAFNKEKALDENSAASLGLKPYTAINTSQKEINIVNNYSILKELKVDNQTIDFNPNLTEFNLICQTNDPVVFNTTDDKNFRQINNTFASIERKFIPRPQEPRHYAKGGKKTFWEENGAYLGILLLIVMIGAGVFYYFKRGNNSDDPIQNTISNTEANQSLETGDEGITFKNVGEITDSIYKTDFKKLDNYRFKFHNGKWQYQKDGQSYIDFYVEDIKNMINNNHLNVKVDDFKNKLEKKSGHEIVNKETSKNQNEIKESDKNPASKSNNQNSTPKSNSPSKGTSKPIQDTKDPIDNVGKDL